MLIFFPKHSYIFYFSDGVLPPCQHVRLKCTPKWHGCPNDLLPIFWVEKICEFPKESKDLRIVTMVIEIWNKIVLCLNLLLIHFRRERFCECYHVEKALHCCKQIYIYIYIVYIKYLGFVVAICLISISNPFKNIYYLLGQVSQRA